MRAALRAISSVLIVSGVLLLADALLTLVWQEPVSALMAYRDQGRLDDRLRDLEGDAPTAADREVLRALGTDSRRLAYLGRTAKRRASDGDALGRIRIPRAGADFVFVKGTTTEPLKKGPGLYPQTPLPGVGGTTAIAGHRTTYLAPFRRIDRLRPGDPITIDVPYGSFTYRVEKRLIVEPTATWVIRRVRYDRLVLTACHPLYSAAQRIVIFARLVKTEPRGATRTLVERPSRVPLARR